MTCGCSKYSSTSPHTIVKNKVKNCDKVKTGKRCSYGSPYQTEASERIAIRRNKHLCCPPEPFYTNCKKSVCKKTCSTTALVL